MNILINEIYSAVQGEGPFTGTPCTFIRVQTCPVKCAWCDTAYTWDGTEKGTKMTVEELVDKTLALGREHVVITGGEPIVLRDQVEELIISLFESDVYQVEVETSGIAPPFRNNTGRHAFVHYNVSPKLPSARAIIQPDPKIIDTYLEEDAILKFVIKDLEDLDAMEKLLDECHEDWRSDRVWLMPEGRTRLELSMALRNLLEIVDKRKLNYKVTDRMHLVAYDGQRGV